jgi:hypothetical protein
VPCSRSRMTAAPVSTTGQRLIWLMIATTLLNHAEIAFGLNSFRTDQLDRLLRRHVRPFR